MKTFRMIGMALIAVMMCANFASCSKEDDTTSQGNDGIGGEEVVAKEKKLAKIVGVSGSDAETYEFSYDDKGRVVKASEIDKYDDSYYKYEYQFVWGDDAIIANIKGSSNSDSDYSYSSTLTLEDGLVQSCNDDYDGDETYSYNKSGRISSRKFIVTQSYLWDSDKLVSVIYKEPEKRVFTYGTSCQKGYIPLFLFRIEIGYEILYLANPEPIGARTTQLPTSGTYINSSGEEGKTTTFAYEFDKEGYITKVTAKQDGETTTYTLTWK